MISLLSPAWPASEEKEARFALRGEIRSHLTRTPAGARWFHRGEDSMKTSLWMSVLAVGLLGLGAVRGQGPAYLPLPSHSAPFVGGVQTPQDVPLISGGNAPVIATTPGTMAPGGSGYGAQGPAQGGTGSGAPAPFGGGPPSPPGIDDYL